MHACGYRNMEKKLNKITLSEKQTNILLSAMKKVILPNLELSISTGPNAMLRYV